MNHNILFIDTQNDYKRVMSTCNVLHILCTGGSISFMFRDVRYNIAPRDYVILPNASLASGFSASAGFSGIGMSLSDTYVARMAIRSDYGITGHLSLLQNPVMRLTERDFRVCLDGMTHLRRRLDDRQHTFYDEMTGSLLTAHILDLYDIHARTNTQTPVSEHTAVMLRRFIELLYRGEYITHRDLGHYASELCVTPHYLSEICRKACGRPASYWIDRFTVNHITRMLCTKDVPIGDIASRFNFSSLSYFSRYVQRHIGMSPSEYRNSIK